MIVKSTDCGATFGSPVAIADFIPYDAQDESDPEAIPTPQSQPDDPLDEEGTDAGRARDCGDFGDHCTSGYTFFRRDTQVRSTADQLDTAHEMDLHRLRPVEAGYPDGDRHDLRFDHAGDRQPIRGLLHTLRRSGRGAYQPGVDRPPGRRAISCSRTSRQTAGCCTPSGGTAGTTRATAQRGRLETAPTRRTVPSLDVFAATSTDSGQYVDRRTSKLTDVTSNPNYEQFDNRAVPFAGDYLWVTSLGPFAYGVWTDYRNTVQGTDPREVPEDEDNSSADVLQCRVT